MWLIDVQTFELKNFFGRNVAKDHPYAILSHTWEEDEVTFQDMQHLEKARTKNGFWKIEQTCQQAKAESLDYAWVDTCCIDKSSSSELQEAINSMFEWYARASRCYAFLSDVQGSYDFTSSRWFTRGWTLQELIAPRGVIFYDQRWHEICTRSGESGAISERTGIPISMLIDHRITMRRSAKFKRFTLAVGRSSLSEPRCLSHYSVAMRMSWASQRETSRIEDRAYCLMGLFGVSMPLLYGEGRQSFVRLQEEIVRRDTDLSILAWELPKLAEPNEDDEDEDDDDQSLLAFSPRCFETCGDIIFHTTSDSYESSAERTLSAVGLRATLSVIPLHIDHREQANYAAVLSCYRESDITSTIALKLISKRSVGNSMPGIERDSEALPMLPYSKGLMRHWRNRRRTIGLDVLRVEESDTRMLKPLIILRQLPTSTIRSVELHETLVGREDTPSYVWFRSATQRPGASWYVTHLFPESEWNKRTLTFKITGAANNHAKGPALDGGENQYANFIMGSIALRRSDVVDSRVVISFVCPVSDETQVRCLDVGNHVLRTLRPEPRKIFFRVETIGPERRMEDPRDLLHDCAKLMAEDVPVDNAAFSQGRNLLSAKAVHLYGATGLYETSIFAVKPEFKTIAGRWTVVLHAFDLTNMAQLKQLDEPSDVPICQRIEPPNCDVLEMVGGQDATWTD